MYTIGKVICINGSEIYSNYIQIHSILYNFQFLIILSENIILFLLSLINDNATARTFIVMLPLTLNMLELNGNEKYNFLSNNLPSAASNQGTINYGDLMLWGSNCIVLFYETFNTSYSYTKIGTIDDPTDLKTALGSGNSTVKFELLSNFTAVETVNNNDIKYSIINGILEFTPEINKITILGINGTMVLSTSTNVIDVNNLPAGIYVLKIRNADGNKIIKIII